MQERIKVRDPTGQTNKIIKEDKGRESTVCCMLPFIATWKNLLPPINE